MTNTAQAASACEPGDPKLAAVAELLRTRFGHPERVLVVGCGDGTEAALLADLLGAYVAGIDVVDEFHDSARQRANLIVADATALPFAAGSFDLAFSYHALEHIPSPQAALREIRRVLNSEGGCWIGTPNRSRLLGYLGSRDASARDKVLWNLAEWRARLRGRFRNELGAHAGFTPRELRAMFESEFRVVENETAAYYALLYPRYRWLFAVFERLGLSRFICPSIYFAGCRPQSDGSWASDADTPPRA